MSRRGFSLIEVLFAVTFLVLVGMAMITLNAASSRLVATSELKVSAQALADEAINFIALQKKTLPSGGGPGSFAATYAACIDGGKTCYVNCPTTITASCTLTPTATAIQIGQSKLSYSRLVNITSVPTNQYLVKVKTSWGSGIGRQITINQLLQ